MNLDLLQIFGISAILTACGPDSVPPTALCAATPIATSDTQHCLVVATSDFSAAAGISVIDTHSGCVQQDLTSTWHDAVVVVDQGEIYVVNRQGGDNIQHLNASMGFRTLWQRSVGNGANPVDLAIAGSRGFVPLYNEGAVAVVELSVDDDRDFLSARIELPTSAEADGRAEPSAVWVRDSTLFVLLDGLGDYPRCGDGRGRILAYDTETLDPVSAFDGDDQLVLAFCNPGTSAWLDADRLLLGAAGNFRSLTSADEITPDGGLEIINLATGRSEGVILSETELGDRDVLDLSVGPTGRVWITLADTEFMGSVHPLRLNGAVAGNVVGDAVWRGEGIFDIIEVDGVLWVGDRSPAAAGLVPIDAVTGEQLGPPVLTGLPPFSIAAIEGPEGCFTQ